MILGIGEKVYSEKNGVGIVLDIMETTDFHIFSVKFKEDDIRAYLDCGDFGSSLRIRPSNDDFLYTISEEEWYEING